MCIKYILQKICNCQDITRLSKLSKNTLRIYIQKYRKEQNKTYHNIEVQLMTLYKAVIHLYIMS